MSTPTLFHVFAVWLKTCCPPCPGVGMPPKRGSKRAPTVVTRFDDRGVHVFKGSGQNVESFRDLHSAFAAGKPAPAKAAAAAAAGQGEASSSASAVDLVLEDKEDAVAAPEEPPEVYTPCTNRKRPHAEGALEFLAPVSECLRALLGAGTFPAADQTEAAELLAGMSAIMSAEMAGNTEQQDWTEILRLHTDGLELMSRLHNDHQTAEATQRTPQSVQGSPWQPGTATSPPSLLAAAAPASAASPPPKALCSEASTPLHLLTPPPKPQKTKRTLSPDKE